MGNKTGIQWCDATWNPWMGCRKVSPGCKNCYMFREMKTYGQDPGVIRRSKTKFQDPMKWLQNWNKGIRTKNALAPGSKIFTCSWSDFFIPDADPWRDEAWAIIKSTPQYIYQILTKRPDLIKDRLPSDWGNGYPNVWLIVSTEDQTTYEERMRMLIDIPAAVKGISAEPLLSPIYLHWSQHLDWVITGGESGPGARPTNPVWIRNIIDQCSHSMIPLFHKQNGGTKKIDGAWGGRVFEGRTYDQLPEPKRNRTSSKRKNEERTGRLGTLTTINI